MKSYRPLTFKCLAVFVLNKSNYKTKYYESSSYYGFYQRLGCNEGRC